MGWGTGMPRRTVLLRQILRRGVELSLVRAGGARLARWLRPVDTVVLAYHDITRDQQAPFGERSLHLPADQFRRGLAPRALRAGDPLVVVPLRSLVATPQE